MSYQGAMIETHRDGLQRFSARSVRCGDAGYRKTCATPSESLCRPPFRSRRWSVGGRRKVLPMHRIACTFPPTRRTAYAISMGLYHCSLVLERIVVRLNHSDGLWRVARQAFGAARCGASRKANNAAGARQRPPFGRGILNLGCVALLARGPATRYEALLPQNQKYPRQNASI